jgi:putative oxidoreductase
MAYGLLLLRLVAGLTMFGHGTQKLFGWFGGHGVKGTAGFFDQLGFRSAALMALLAAMSETVGGVLFALGLVTPLAAFLIAIVMLNAIRTVHYRKGFWVMSGGYEFNLLLLTVVVAIAATGPGRFSLDRLIGWDDELTGVWWAVGIFVAALAGSIATTELFRKRSAAVQPQPG